MIPTYIKNQVYNRFSRFFGNKYTTQSKINDLLERKSTAVVLFNHLTPYVNLNIESKSYQLTTITSDQYKEINFKSIQVLCGPNNQYVAVSYYDDRESKIISLLNDKFKKNTLLMRNPFDANKLMEKEMWKKLRGLFAWHYSNMFCGLCGTETISNDSGYKRICQNENCFSRKETATPKWTNYPRIDPVVIVLPVSKKDPKNGQPACLLARKSFFPLGLMSCISGFIDPGESAEMAATRELKEEVNLECEKLKFISSDYWPFPSSLLFGFQAEVPELSKFHLNDNELNQASWFNLEEVKLLLERKHLNYSIAPESSLFYMMIKVWYNENK